jgi:YgiT-type zinc finger domain-containing protein
MQKPRKDYLLQVHDRYMDCPTCDGYMVPSTEDYIKKYKGHELVIRNLPIFKCECIGCKEVMYGSGDLYKIISYAKKQFDNHGMLVFNANDSKRIYEKG